MTAGKPPERSWEDLCRDAIDQLAMRLLCAPDTHPEILQAAKSHLAAPSVASLGAELRSWCTCRVRRLRAICTEDSCDCSDGGTP